MEDRKTYRNFYYFLLGQEFSLLGSSIVYFIISWWIAVETDSAFYLAISSVLYFLPQIIIAPIAGVLSDKISRKFIIILVDSFQAVVTFGLFILFTFNLADIWLVLIVNTSRSVLQSFHVPTFNAIIPSMVPKQRLNRVNSINLFFSSLIYTIGPILAGALYEFFPINQIFMIDIITFIIALVPILIITIPRVGLPKDHKEKTSFFKEFKIGLKAVKSAPGLLSLIFLAMLLNFLNRPFSDLLPLFVKKIHNGTAIELAFISSFMSVGNIVGSFINSFKKEWKRKTLIIMIGSISIFGGYSFLVFSPYRFFIIVGIGLFISGLSFNFILINYMTILQIAVPKDKVGRIVSLDHSITFAIIPLGSLTGGFLAELINLKAVYLINILIAIIIAILIWIFSDIHKLDYIIEEDNPKTFKAA
ncbi:MAG: MFS transporter [Promethearchaeota archaeon]